MYCTCTAEPNTADNVCLSLGWLVGSFHLLKFQNTSYGGVLRESAHTTKHGEINQANHVGDKVIKQVPSWYILAPSLSLRVQCSGGWYRGQRHGNVRQQHGRAPWVLPGVRLLSRDGFQPFGDTPLILACILNFPTPMTLHLLREWVCLLPYWCPGKHNRMVDLLGAVEWSAADLVHTDLRAVRLRAAASFLGSLCDEDYDSLFELL